MEGIRQWAFSVCAAMLTCGIARMLIPKGNMQKVFGVTVSAFLLCGILSPVLLQKPELRLEIRSAVEEDIQKRADRLAESVEEQERRAAAGGIKKIVGEKLEEMGINYLDITIHMNHNGQSKWNVGQVEVTLDSTWNEDAAVTRRKLENFLGLEVYLRYAGKEGITNEVESG